MEKNINQDLKWLEKIMWARFKCDNFQRIAELEGIDEKEARAKKNYRCACKTLAKIARKGIYSSGNRGFLQIDR